ncbi:MAG: hypothetical protein ACXWUG_22335 [Polyangiales bacterium]
MAKTAPSPFLQAAVREKAERDLAAIDVRVAAFDGVEKALDTLVELSTSLAESTPAIAQTAPDPVAVTKLKKLRRAVDEARALAEEIATSLDVRTQREGAIRSRAEIVEALVAAGLDPATLSAGGEAE